MSRRCHCEIYNVKKVSLRDIQMVQHLIEQCLQLYMNQKEVVGNLLQQAKIEPGFTELIWQNLEKQNQEFFEAYHVRLMLKEQILEFNQLLEKQADIMHQVAETDSISISNGFQISPMHQDISYCAPDQTRTSLKTDYQSIYSGLPAFTNGRSSLHPNMQISVKMPAHARRVNGSAHMQLGQKSNVGMILGLNGEIMKHETGFADTSSFLYGGANVNLLLMPFGNPSVPLLSGTESNSQTLNDSTLDLETSSFGYLGQFSQNFSLSDLTANFSSSDIMESYSETPFLEANMDNIFDGEH